MEGKPRTMGMKPQITSMDKFESTIKTIPCKQEQVYNTLSDLSNLEKFKDKIPDGKINSMAFDNDKITVNVEPVGNLTINIVECEPCKTIKFGSPNTPMDFNLWVQIAAIDEATCKIKVTIKIELNMLTRTLMKNKLQQAVEKLAEVLSKIPYA